MSCPKRVPLGLAALLIFMSSASLLVGDEVVLNDGTRIVGRILRLKDKQVEVETKHLDNLWVDVSAVTELYSEERFVIEMHSGERITATVDVSDGLLVVGEGRKVPLSEVFATERLRGPLELAVSGGAYIVRGNSQTTSYDLHASVGRHTTKSYTTANASTTLNEQEEAEDTQRYTFDLLHERYVGQANWSVLGGLNLESNEAAGLESRTILVLAVGRSLFSTPNQRLGALIGVAGIREDYVDTPRDEATTMTLGLNYLLSPGDISFKNRLAVFSPFNGRVLVQFDSTLRIDLINDFFLSIDYYDRYDTEPPIELGKRDYGMTLGVGWSN